MRRRRSGGLPPLGVYIVLKRAHKWIGTFLLHSPARIRLLRNVPILGTFIHQLSHRILPKNERVWARVQSGPAQGISLELDPRTGDAYLRGELEIATQKVLAERLRPGMVFYDLGANIGLFSLLAARIVGAGGRVFSFEPDAKVAVRLRRNIAQNVVSNITVIEAGIWSTNGTGYFVADESSPERVTGRFLMGENQTDGMQVRSIALDDFIQSAPPPDAIKCDVEGAEIEALRGAKGLLHLRRPWIICEIHSEANDRMVREFLHSTGYEVKSIDVNHILALP